LLNIHLRDVVELWLVSCWWHNCARRRSFLLYLWN